MSITKFLKDVVLDAEYLISNNKKNSKIVFYHDVHGEKENAYTRDSTSIEMFQRHIEIIKNCGFQIVDKITEKENQVLISFDDGWAGIYQQKDFFINNQIFPTISIAPGLLNLDGYLTDNNVKELYNLGFKFNCHTWTHQNITLYNNNDCAMIRELLDSKHYIEDLLSTSIDTICFPQGRFSKKTYEKSLDFGYKEMWSCIDGDYWDDIFPCVKRRNLAQSINEKEIKRTLLGTNKIQSLRHQRQHYSINL